MALDTSTLNPSHPSILLLLNGDRQVTSPSTCSGEVKVGIAGAPECTRRLALFWKVTAEGKEVVEVEVAWVVGYIVWAEGLSRAAPAAAGSGKVE
jgi:hypothetical protein